MLNISVKHDLKRLSQDLTRIQRRDLPKAVSAALNKTRANVLTIVKREVSGRTGVAQKVVKDALSEQRSTPQRLITSIAAKKRTFNLIRFVSGKQAKGDRGLKAKAFGTKARVFPGTFIGRSGRTAFVRKNQGDPRSKIKAAHGPSIPRAMMSPKVQKVISKRVAEQFPKNLRSQLKRTFDRKR